MTTTTTTTTRRAFALDGGTSARVTDVPNHPVRAEYIKIQVAAVALNPTDWKHMQTVNSRDAVLGMDVAGTVVAVGADVPAGRVAVGDRVAGMCHGGNRSNGRDGGFAEQAEIKHGLFARLPASLSFAEAATLGTGVTTVGQGLFQSLQLPLPAPTATLTPAQASGPWLLVYGAASATGSLAVQYAALAGARVVVTARTQHHAWLQRLGAQLAFDYQDADVGAQIRAATGDALHLAFDTITNPQSQAICAAALASRPSDAAPNHYSALLPVTQKDFPRPDDCHVRFTLAYTAIGEKFDKWGQISEAQPEHLAFATQFWHLTEQLLARGSLQVHPLDQRSGGLEGIAAGLKDLEAGNVSGKKVVYEL